MNKGAGKVYCIGLGPGGREQMTLQALEAIKDSQVIIGYALYVDLISDLLAGKEVIASAMRQELERCRQALELAQAGKKVALVSSGDPGIYGMAGPLLELNSREGLGVAIEIVPGLTAASMAGALLGAPLMHDTALVSLSDLLTPWEVIEKRLRLAAEADFVTVLYNPKSNGRPHYIELARDIFMQHRSLQTPVGIVRNASRQGEEALVTTLDKMLLAEIDMTSIVIIGNSQSWQAEGRFITPRGYVL